MNAQFFALIFTFALCQPAHGQEDDRPYAKEGGTFSITMENDVVSGVDRDYTNGFRASWVTAADEIPTLLEPFADALPFFPEGGDKRVSYAVGQSMFTPDNISAYTLQRKARPYAGWLYGTVGLVSDTGDQLDTLELTLGIVGPLSRAHQTQHFVHHYITGSPKPHGWYHQLENEPGLVISYERKWRSYYQFSILDGYGVDFTPSIGGSLGNVLTALETGATVRFGKSLPADYGPPRVRPALSGSDFFIATPGFTWYVFAGVQGRYIARNIFLDGNSFSSSHSVDKESFVGDWQAGVAFTFGKTRLTMSHIHRSREFKGQEEADAFGAITLSLQF